MALAAAHSKLGLKRICTSCSSRFYDMNKRPIICPSCDTQFVLEQRLKNRKPRPAANQDEEILPELVADAEVEATEEESAIVSLEDVEVADDDEDEEATDLDIDDIDDLDDDDLDDDDDVDLDDDEE